ncbi:hypothetical protein GCM10009780_00270 [Actinomadura alba]
MYVAFEAGMESGPLVKAVDETREIQSEVGVPPRASVTCTVPIAPLTPPPGGALPRLTGPDGAVIVNAPELTVKVTVVSAAFAVGAVSIAEVIVLPASSAIDRSRMWFSVAAGTRPSRTGRDQKQRLIAYPK